jgi:hypothetical protein
MRTLLLSAALSIALFGVSGSTSTAGEYRNCGAPDWWCLSDEQASLREERDADELKLTSTIENSIGEDYRCHAPEWWCLPPESAEAMMKRDRDLASIDGRRK